MYIVVEGRACHIGFERLISINDEAIMTEFDPHIVWTLSGPNNLAQSKEDALRKAYELSSKTSSWLDAPSFITCVATNEKFDAYSIVAEWDARGWPRPIPHV